MNLTLSTHLHSFRACLNVAYSEDFIHIWRSSPPAEFRSEMAKLSEEVEALSQKAALAERVAGGAAEAKAIAQRALEESTYVLARALTLQFTRAGDFDRRGRVDLSRRDVTRVRTQDLLDRATAIRDIAASVVGQPGAEDRGITAERVEETSQAIATFSSLMGTPRGQLAHRGTLLRELEEGVKALRVRLSTLDDLVLQFNRTQDGLRLIGAWRRARVLVDLRGNSGAPSQPEAPAAQATPDRVPTTA